MISTIQINLNPPARNLTLNLIIGHIVLNFWFHYFCWCTLNSSCFTSWLADWHSTGAQSAIIWQLGKPHSTQRSHCTSISVSIIKGRPPHDAPSLLLASASVAQNGYISALFSFLIYHLYYLLPCVLCCCKRFGSIFISLSLLIWTCAAFAILTRVLVQRVWKNDFIAGEDVASWRWSAHPDAAVVEETAT